MSKSRRKSRNCRKKKKNTSEGNGKCRRKAKRRIKAKKSVDVVEEKE